jgi:elongation factor Ts
MLRSLLALPRIGAAAARARAPRFSSAAAAAAPAAAVPASLVKQLREMTGAPMMDCKNALVAEGADLQRAVDWLRKKGVSQATKKAGRTAAQGLVAVALDEAKGDSAAIVEINSETDFVARNAAFQGLATRVAAGALAALPAASRVGGAARAAADDAAAAAALAAAPLPGGDSLGTPCNVGAGVTDVIAKVGENCVLRRAARLSVAGGVVAPYIHNAAAPGLGSIGVLVGLKPAGGAPALVKGTPAFSGAAELARKVAMHVAAARPACLARAEVPTEALEREKTVLVEQARASGKAEALIAKIVEGRLNKYYSEVCLVEQP